MSIKISICMPVYNGTQFLERAFRNLAKQTRRDFEVVMVDDGSRDGSYEDGMRLLKTHGLAGTVIRQYNRGPEQARDLACANSVGEFLAPYDCDDEWGPSYLEEMAGVLDRHPEVGLVYCDFDEDFVVEKKVIRKSSVTPWIDRNVAATATSAVHVFPHGSFFDLLVQGQVLFPPVTMMRRSLFESINGYCASHPLMRISLDWCFGLRASRKTAVAYIDKALVRKSRHGANVSGNQITTSSSDVAVLAALLTDPTLTDSQRAHACRRASQRCKDVAYQEWSVNGNGRVARSWLRRSMRFHFSRRAAIMLVKTYIPTSLIGALRQRRDPLADTRQHRQTG